MRLSKSAWLLLPFLLAGCSLLFGPGPDRTRLYVLTAIDASETAAPGAGVSVGIQTLRLPAYLEGYDIVTRAGANELRRAPLERWAEPLDDSFKRALGQNLAVLLNTQRVLTSPWFGAQPPQFALSIQVERFEANNDATAILIARWVLRRGTDQTTVIVRESRYSRAIASHSTTAAVDALSNCLADLSRDIAAAIETAD